MPLMPTKSKKVIEEQDLEPEYIDELTIDPDEFVTFRKSQFFTVISILTFVLGVGVGYVVWGTDLVLEKSSQVASQAEVPVVEAPVEEPQFVRYEVASAGFPGIGPDDAPIVIVEFSDYQCPYCKRWHEQVYQPLLNEYPGKIRLVYRHLPLTSIHPDAFPAAEAAMCAGEQNAYWPYHEKLFNGESLGSSIYTQYAQELGLDVNAFETCITEHKYQEAIQSDLDFAVNLGVRSTPTFFINASIRASRLR